MLLLDPAFYCSLILVIMLGPFVPVSLLRQVCIALGGSLNHP
jgi:hypothetical protein